MNESVIRSPKWLRKFADFELHTGEDIKGSKRELRKKEKERILQEQEKWKRRWDSMDEDLFKEFYVETFPKEFHGLIYKRDLEEIYKIYLGNFDIWNKFDAWNLKKKQEEKEQEKIKNDLNDLYERILSDWRNNPYEDKVSTPGNRIEYRFENDDKFTMSGDDIIFEDSKHTMTFTVGLLYNFKFTDLFNHIIGQINKGSAKKRNYRPRSSTKSSSYSSHPRAKVYDTIKDTIKERERELSKMSKNDPKRVGLENELSAAKSRVKEMNSKYKFEGIKNFYDYFSTIVK